LRRTDFVCGLKIHPELFAGTKKLCQAHGSIRSDAALFEHNVVYSWSGYVKLLGQLVSGKTERFQEFFAQDFSWMNPPTWSCGAQSTHEFHLVQLASEVLMVIRNFDIKRIAIIPYEPSSILIIYPDRKPASPVPLHSFKPVAWSRSQIL
jgi:hypothetical protein